MNTSNVTQNVRPGARLSDREALHEMLVASLTLAFQLGDSDTGECVMQAIRVLHRDEPVDEEPGDVAFE